MTIIYILTYLNTNLIIIHDILLKMFIEFDNFVTIINNNIILIYVIIGASLVLPCNIVYLLIL